MQGMHDSFLRQIILRGRIMERICVLKKRLFGISFCSMVFILTFLLAFIYTARPVHAASTKKIKMELGESKRLKKGSGVWVSSNPNVVSVGVDGRAVAVSGGNAVVVGKVSGKKYRFKITVKAPYLSATELKISLEHTKTLKLKGSDKKFTFRSSDPSIVKVIKKKKNVVRLEALKDGVVKIMAKRGSAALYCTVVSGKGSAEVMKTGTFTLNFRGVPIQTLTYNKSDVGRYVSSISGFGQSAPLYVSANGGDGLESIFAATNNGNVNVAGVQLSPEAVQGTIAKACLWARAICDSPYHGYDDGQVNEIDCWGIAKSNAPGTGDYCCFSLTECAYYFAGVNLLGECLGNPEAAIYPPFSEMLFLRGGVSFWGDSKPRSTAPFDSQYLYPKAGFVEITTQKNMAGNSFVYQAGDIAVSAHSSHQHEQLIIKSGTKDNCEVAEACGPGSGGRTGGDQSGGELCVYSKLYKPGEVNHVYRFTGAGVVLNTVGLVG